MTVYDASTISDFQALMPTMDDVVIAEAADDVDFCNAAGCTTSDSNYCGKPKHQAADWRGSHLMLEGYATSNGNALCLDSNANGDEISAAERGAKACSFFCSRFATCAGWQHYPGVGQKSCLLFTAAAADTWVPYSTGTGTGSTYSWIGCRPL